MSVAPDPAEVYRRAAEEGHRRLDYSLLELLATAFIAGLTIVFGVLALGIAEAFLHPLPAGIASLGGALAFATGLVLLVVGRTELFTEDFFDSVAATIDRRTWTAVGRLGRLWVLTLALNLVGGAVLSAVAAVPGVLPHGTAERLVRTAEELVSADTEAVFFKAIIAGALLTLMSFLLHAVDSVVGRILIAYLVGFLVAVGAFAHVVVSAVQMYLALLIGDTVTWAALWPTLAVVTVGNLVGGLGLMTLTHTAQVKGAG